MTPSAKAAQQIALQIERHVIDWIAGEKNGCGLATIREIVQIGLDKALRARDAEIEGLVTACHHLAMTYANNSLHSNDMNKFLKEIGFTQALSAITKEQPK